MEIESINTGNSSYDKIRHKDSHQQSTQKSQSFDEDFDKPDDLENDDLDQVSPKSKHKTDTSSAQPGMIKTDTGYVKDPHAVDPNLPYEDFYGKDTQDVYTSTAGSLRNNGAPLYSDPIAAREALKEQYNKAKGITGEKTTEADLQQQQQFLETAQTVDGEGNVTTDPRVSAMLEMGLFSDNDSQGKSLMENLNALKNQKFHQGIDGNQVYQEVLDTLSNPLLVNQGNKATCGATIPQYKLVKENPAEYVRLLSGITGQSGSVQMRNGDSLALNQSALSEDGSYRSMTDKLFQSSLMEYGKDDLRYNNTTDKHYQADKIDNSGILYTNDIFGTKAPKSLTAGNITKVMDALLPYESELKFYMHSDENKAATDKVEQEMKSSLQSGYSVPVGIYWTPTGKGGDHAAHQLTVESIQEDKVILRNPWGQGDDGSTSQGLPRQLLTDQNGQHGGMIAIDKDLFFEKMFSYEIRKGNENNEENLH